MQIETDDSWSDRQMLREYYIFHKDDPEKKVRLRTIQHLSLKQIKEKIVKNGLFNREVIKELRVERINR